MIRSTYFRYSAAATLLALVMAIPITAQAQAAQADSVTMVLGPQYRAGWFHRLILGSGYRETWTTPVDIPVLDLATYAGGLTPLRVGGGQQTASLRLAGSDGRQYTFRSIIKDPVGVLPQELRQTIVSDLIEDQMSAAHPVGALIVPRILEAVGVLHVQPELFVMPDSPLLGEFREQFSGAPGLLEERPRDDDDPGISFAGAKEVVSTVDVRDALEENPDVRINAEAFLDARLVDVFLGDWDRHQDQWRWARMVVGDSEQWLPIPRDRDQAFVKFEGLALDVARVVAPRWVVFGPEYPSVVAATWNGRNLDREFLTELSREAWQRRAAAIRDLISDEVIVDAVNSLPSGWLQVDGERLVVGLKARRDLLPELAEDYYEFLAENVDIWATDEDELASVRSDIGGTTTVSIARRESPQAPWYTRTFFPEETREVRIYLRGGKDSTAIERGDHGGIKIRAIGGGSDDQFVNDGRRGVSLYDDRGDNVVIGGDIDERPYQARANREDVRSLPHRDWGAQSMWLPTINSSTEAGFLIGATGNRRSYSFRHKPYGSYFSWGIEAAPSVSSGRARIDSRWYAENSSRYIRAEALVSGIEILRWYGLGNETVNDSTVDDKFYQASEHQARIDLAVGWRLSDRVEIRFGPRAAFAVMEVDEGANATRFIAQDAPYGTGNFAQAGFGGAVRYDTRDVAANARSGVLLEMDGVGYPALLDVDDAFGRIHGRVGTYLSSDGFAKPVLALLAGGSATFGTDGRIPFHELAFLGSGTTLRGYQTDRFAGQHAAYASAELRLELTSLKLLIPGRQGLFGFYDLGRVWADGEDSDEWHNSIGGGVWFGALTQGGVLSAALASSEEGSRLHLRLGFAW